MRVRLGTFPKGATTEFWKRWLRANEDHDRHIARLAGCDHLDHLGRSVTDAFVIEAIVGVPACRMICSVSRRKMVRTASTPGCPKAAKPHAGGRPTPTAVAPSASALKTSVPRLNPLSIITGILPFAPCTTSGKHSIVER